MSQKASTGAQPSEVQPHQLGQEVFKAILPEDVDWKPFPAFPPSVRLAVVVGQPSKPGPYTIRVKSPHGAKLMPHKHSGERTRGRRNIQGQRASQPSKKRFTVRRIIGGGDLWITEFILTYDGKPSYTVSIMEFKGDKVARETQYFADPFVAPASRAQWVERMDT